MSEHPRCDRLLPTTDVGHSVILEESAVNEINTVLDSYVQGLPIKKVQRHRVNGTEETSELSRKRTVRNKNMSSRNVDGRWLLMR
jgi:hypothetical protein